jgi:hypothetical protein
VFPCVVTTTPEWITLRCDDTEEVNNVYRTQSKAVLSLNQVSATGISPLGGCPRKAKWKRQVVALQAAARS